MPKTVSTVTTRDPNFADKFAPYAKTAVMVTVTDTYRGPSPTRERARWLEERDTPIADDMVVPMLSGSRLGMMANVKGASDTTTPWKQILRPNSFPPSVQPAINCGLLMEGYCVRELDRLDAIKQLPGIAAKYPGKIVLVENTQHCGVIRVDTIDTVAQPLFLRTGATDDFEVIFHDENDVPVACAGGEGKTRIGPVQQDIHPKWFAQIALQQTMRIARPSLLPFIGTVYARLFFEPDTGCPSAMHVALLPVAPPSVINNLVAVAVPRLIALDVSLKEFARHIDAAEADAEARGKRKPRMSIKAEDNWLKDRFRTALNSITGDRPGRTRYARTTVHGFATTANFVIECQSDLDKPWTEWWAELYDPETEECAPFPGDPRVVNTFT